MLIVHRAERADQLVGALGGILVEARGDPVQPEIVAVPTRGVERWISQRLSNLLGVTPGGTDGVCANLVFPHPWELAAGAVARAAHLDPAGDPWTPERLIWPLIDVIDAHGDDPALRALGRHLDAATPPPRPTRLADRGASGPQVRRLATARHVAELFGRYALYRPDMVLGWAAGGDDGAAGEAGWQPHLWRLLRHRLAEPSPAERLAAAVATIRSTPEVLDLPERFSVFGLTRAPAAHLQALDAVAAHRDVHLFVLHPSAGLWERTAATVASGPLARRGEDPAARLARHPLLRSWGRDSREMQSVLGSLGAAGSHHYPMAPPPPTLLGRIQAAVRADDPLPVGDAPGPAVLEPADRSVQIHSCHGRMRQVEVLRDAILHLLEDDPTLEARDVIVMCPDIETYAPLVHAAFDVAGADSSSGEGARLPRVRMADRSLRQTNPLLSVAAELLDLAASRVSASGVVDLLSRPAVSRRFGFDAEEMATIERWVAGTSVRWGLDAAHRRPWHLEGLDANTWSAGLDRLLLGVAMSASGGHTFAGSLPYDETTSTEVDLAGRYAEALSRLGWALDRLEGPYPLDEWIGGLIEATEMMARPAADESWQSEEVRAVLTQFGDPRPGWDMHRPELTLHEVRSLLAVALQGRPTRANFRTGDLTICTLTPMRSVPHRVVALLGLDDGAFPRPTQSDGDDLLGRDPRTGDPDSRSEDRQLLLDALLAAEEHLVITYCGRDERTNRVRPPCAPVAELMDVIDAMAVAPGGGPARSVVVVAHPLQPYDGRNFEDAALLPGGPWSFDPVHLRGATAARSGPAPVDEGGLLPDAGGAELPLEALVAFAQHPVRAFLRTRLSLFLGDWSEQIDDRLPLELDPLERWSLGDRMLESVLAGADLGSVVDAERLRGTLPPGVLAVRLLDSVAAGVAAIRDAAAARGFVPAASSAAQVRVELLGGRTLWGSVPQTRGDTILQCTYSRLAPKHRLAAWVRFLALTADQPERPIRAVSIGRGRAPGSVAVASLGPLPGPAEARLERARSHLGVLADLYDRGMRQALPLVCAASAAWAEGRRAALAEDQLLGRSSEAWQPNGDIPGECDQPEHVFVFGRRSDVRSLMSERPAPDETGPGWAADEPNRFGRLARRLWDPLLGHETVEEL